MLVGLTGAALGIEEKGRIGESRIMWTNYGKVNDVSLRVCYGVAKRMVVTFTPLNDYLSRLAFSD